MNILNQNRKNCMIGFKFTGSGESQNGGFCLAVNAPYVVYATINEADHNLKVL